MCFEGYESVYSSLWRLGRLKSTNQGRDWSDPDTGLLSWIDTCPICHIRKRASHDVNADHKLETCQDE